MKKLTLLFATLCISFSSLAFSQEGLIKVGDAYAIKNDGSRVYGGFNHLCYELLSERNRTGQRVVQAEWTSFLGDDKRDDGSKARKMRCKAIYEKFNYDTGEWWSNGLWSRSSPWGPARCDEGGIYNGFAFSCWKYPDQQ